MEPALLVAICFREAFFTHFCLSITQCIFPLADCDVKWLDMERTRRTSEREVLPT